MDSLNTPSHPLQVKSLVITHEERLIEHYKALLATSRNQQDEVREQISKVLHSPSPFLLGDQSGVGIVEAVVWGGPV